MYTQEKTRETDILKDFRHASDGKQLASVLQSTSSKLLQNSVIDDLQEQIHILLEEIHDIEKDLRNVVSMGDKYGSDMFSSSITFLSKVFEGRKIKLQALVAQLDSLQKQQSQAKSVLESMDKDGVFLYSQRIPSSSASVHIPSSLSHKSFAASSRSPAVLSPHSPVSHVSSHSHVPSSSNVFSFPVRTPSSVHSIQVDGTGIKSIKGEDGTLLTHIHSPILANQSNK
ncbi:hypothetical protein ADUPG1_007204 [Aduncisulcus paluster]|uniref:Uncharacterized protein n=1 Tax=Aduncisulcus paluster TaxID=2918883 RepID=A0ABQ5KPH9_9EUKA|nr:hypothetical protein ADUPG1_007204 [Aduncisulcus paluster]